jgi:hypothetical protein
MERGRARGNVNRLLQGVEAQRDAWIRDGVWKDIPESGSGIREGEGRAVVCGIVHQVLMCLIGEARESDCCRHAGEFNPVAAGSSPRHRAIRFLYARRGGAPGCSFLILLVAVAILAIYPLTVFSLYLDEGRQQFLNHPLFAFVLPSVNGKSLLAKAMEGAFCLNLGRSTLYPNGVGAAEAIARRNVTYTAAARCEPE